VITNTLIYNNINNPVSPYQFVLLGLLSDKLRNLRQQSRLHYVLLKIFNLNRLLICNLIQNRKKCFINVSEHVIVNTFFFISSISYLEIPFFVLFCFYNSVRCNNMLLCLASPWLTSEMCCVLHFLSNPSQFLRFY
jgi:hypothetical protein